jgi:hypothetical protein
MKRIGITALLALVEVRRATGAAALFVLSGGINDVVAESTRRVAHA